MRRDLKGHQPNRRDAKALEVIETAHQPGEIADAVAVGIHKAADRQAVDDGVFVPEIVDHRFPGGRKCRHANAPATLSLPTCQRCPADQLLVCHGQRRADERAALLSYGVMSKLLALIALIFVLACCGGATTPCDDSDPRWPLRHLARPDPRRVTSRPRSAQS